MKKIIFTIATILTFNVVLAQSKEKLKNVFFSLEEKLNTTTKKYDTKLQNFEAKLNGGNATNDELNDMSEGGFGDMNFGEKMSEKETIKVFVEMYEHNAKEGGSSYKDFLGFGKNAQKLEKNADYIKLVKEYASETKKIEAKMYEVGKKYLSTK